MDIMSVSIPCYAAKIDKLEANDVLPTPPLPPRKMKDLLSNFFTSSIRKNSISIKGYLCFGFL